MSNHNICFHGEIEKYYVVTPTYLELCLVNAEKTFSIGLSPVGSLFTVTTRFNVRNFVSLFFFFLSKSM